MTNRGNIERLFKEHYQELYSLALALLKDEDAARDAVHDVFADLLSSDVHGDKGKGYLIRCVRNRCLNQLREMPLRESIDRLVSTDVGLTEAADDQREEYLARMRRIIREELPPQCSRIMQLRFESGLSYMEIADELGISKVAVYKHLRNGLDYIRKKLTCQTFGYGEI